VKRTLVVLDPDAPFESTELLGVMDAMYGEGGSSSYALSLGGGDERLPRIVDWLIRVDAKLVEPHDVANATNCVEELHREYDFDAILVPATPFGRMLAPRAAMRLRVGLVADVTGIRHRRGTIQMVRPAFSGRIVAEVVSTGTGPLMMSVRRNVFTYERRRPERGRIVDFAPRRVDRPRVRLVEQRTRPESGDIRDSEVLVSGGGGVLRSFDQLERLARAMGGVVSASRKVVDGGKAPRRIQVGQSGKTVSPRLYVAIGISGSIQHVVGLRNAGHVVTVNPDRNAPICALSDIVVEGDAREFIPRMVERIERGANASARDE